MQKIYPLLLVALVLSSASASQTLLMPFGSAWKYLDNGTNQGTAWKETVFNDAGWATGNAQLGYGDGDEATVVSYGPNPSKRYITTYFRKTLTVTNASVYSSFTLQLKRDDGAVVFINGVKRFSTNLPNNVTYTTKASSNASDDGNTAQEVTLPAGTFAEGSNVIAVEIHQRNGSSDDISFDLQVTANDNTAPTVTSLNPADNATNVAAGTNLQLIFNEPVQKGSGNIIVRESGITTQTISVSSAAVTVTGNTVTIDPADFGNGAAVNIEIQAGAFKDLAENNYAGIASASTWNFSVFFTDTQPPLVVNYSPADNASGVSPLTNLTLSFNEAIQKGAGIISIKEGGIVTQTLDIASASVTIAGSTVTIDPANFSASAEVNIEMPPGILKDLAGNVFAGITGPLIWNFTIAPPDITAPAVTAFSPGDNTTNIPVNSNLVISFNENIQKGTGNIRVKEAGAITQTIDVSSAAVTVSGNTATINPADFGYNKTVHLEIDPGSFKDLANNQYGGIADAVTWNFQTEEEITGPQTFIPFGASWKYFATGAAPAGNWKNPVYADGAWPSGNGQLGYGDGDESTCVPSGGSGTLCLPSGNKWITTYFRKEVTISNPALFSSFAASVRRDDGIVVYVNGTEVFRNNMPTGTVSFGTLASTAVADDGNTAQNFSISTSLFVSGSNSIAVEIHQSAASSSDISFDMQLTGTVPGAATLTRGPYLNKAVQEGIVIRWRSDVPTNSRVRYGLSAGNLTQSITDNTVTTEHIITLTGLTPNTLYYYSIGSSTQTLQGDAANYFKTMPLAGSEQKIRVMAMGDMGNNSANQVNVRNAWLSFNGTNYTDAWLLMGDNAYTYGTDAEYQNNFFNIYQQSLTKNHVLWPSPGNHDYADNSGRQADHQIPYYDIFSLPRNGEAGGVASNTEAFYSYNYGNIHFVSLDSYGWETGNTRLYDTLGPQAVWLKQDLAANTQPWTIIYFHHPPYTKGSHNSDTESELINMRQRLVPILERFKVDLVLNGHSHSYERSYLINGHYGLENTFSAASHALSSSSAKYNGSSNSCTYIKNAADLRNGIVFAVVGSAGQVGGTSSGYPHNAMYYSDVTNGGTLYFEVENNRLAAKWIGADGVIRDNFTIMKNVNKTTNLTINAGSSITLTASWTGNYNWSTSQTTSSITVSPGASTTYSVTDGWGCLTDVFNVTVLPAPLSRQAVPTANDPVTLIPTTVQKGQSLYVRNKLPSVTMFTLMDSYGRILNQFRATGFAQIPTGNLLPGVYFITWNAGGKTEVKKFLILQ